MKRIATLACALLVVGCGEAAPTRQVDSVTPTQATAPGPTPSAAVRPTFASTPAPSRVPTAEPIAAVSELSMWVDDYVHAFGGHVIVGGLKMDAAGLAAAIRAKPDALTQVKRVAGTAASFLVVNGTPLAMRVGTGRWTESTLATLGDLNGVTFEFAAQEDPTPPAAMIRRVRGDTTISVLAGALRTPQVFRDFTGDDWARVIADWSSIRSALAKGEVSSLRYPFAWQAADEGIRYSRALFGTDGLQIRAQGLYDGPIPVESLRGLKERMHYSNADMLTLLEFTVRTKVLRYPQIAYWDVEDEICDAYVQWSVNGEADYDFWGIATGLTPAQLTLKVAGWVKQDHPDAKTYMTEAMMFDLTNPTGRWGRDYLDEFLPQVAAGNGTGAAKLIDGFIGENNWWIFEPQDWKKVAAKMAEIKALGFPIASSETIIVTGNVPINGVGDPDRVKLVTITDRDGAQAKMYADWLRPYLDKGTKVIGFSGAGDDRDPWPKYAGLTNSNPFFFDQDYRAKESYYAMIQVLYGQLP
jgi:hypothetical protein